MMLVLVYIGVLIPSSSGQQFGPASSPAAQPPAGALQVLIPSSSGQQFGPEIVLQHYPHLLRVLIPSSSGQQFGHRYTETLMKHVYKSLNPFFIRAAIRTRHEDERLQ